MMDHGIIKQSEQFEQLSKEVLPLLEELEKSIKKHNVSSWVNLYMDTTSGYFSFSAGESKWELSRSSHNYPVKMRYDYSKEIELNEESMSADGHIIQITLP